MQKKITLYIIVEDNTEDGDVVDELIYKDVAYCLDNSPHDIQHWDVLDIVDYDEEN